jgi:hypothetical protein
MYWDNALIMDRISQRDCDPNAESVQSTKAVVLGSKNLALNTKEFNTVLCETRTTKRGQML